ncbi:hypothetical protein [Amycolatopsis sp. FDAARGOS 1241]|nr:hypothetical protein [Amycolatopsis sp. FDAARGOS 1241]
MAAPVLDTAVGSVLGCPLPALSLVMLVVLLGSRRRRLAVT